MKMADNPIYNLSTGHERNKKEDEGNQHSRNSKQLELSESHTELGICMTCVTVEFDRLRHLNTDWVKERRIVYRSFEFSLTYGTSSVSSGLVGEIPCRNLFLNRLALARLAIQWRPATL